MGDFYVKGKQVYGNTINASAVTCLDKNGSQSTVQKEIENVQNDIDELNSEVQKFAGTELLTESMSTTSSITIPKSIADFNMIVAVVAYEPITSNGSKTLVFNRAARVNKDMYNVYNTEDTIWIECRLNWSTRKFSLYYHETSTNWTNSLPLVFQSIVGY